MDVRSYVLALLAAAEDVPGRTMMQKLVFLLARQRHEGLPYRPHFYGPYSEEVQAAVDGLVRAGLADESATVYPAWQPDELDAYQYRYRLTADGQEAVRNLDAELASDAVELVDRAKESRAWTQAALATAAKLAYLQDLDPEVRGDELVSRAADFGWRVSEREVEGGAALLRVLDQS